MSSIHDISFSPLPAKFGQSTILSGISPGSLHQNQPNTGAIFTPLVLFGLTIDHEPLSDAKLIKQGSRISCFYSFTL